MKSAGKFPVWHIPGVYFRLKERYSYRVLYVWFVWVEWGAAYPVAARPVHLDLLVGQSQSRVPRRAAGPAGLSASRIARGSSGCSSSRCPTLLFCLSALMSTVSSKRVR
jgi:hypothetical protein